MHAAYFNPYNWIVELPIFLKQLEEKFPGFLVDLEPLRQVFEQVLAQPVDTDLKKAIRAQVEVAAEHFGAILANCANGFGLPAEAAARNLFDLVVGTMYLMKNPHLLTDFIEFGQLTVYRLMKNLEPEDPDHQKAKARDLATYGTEIQRLEDKFDKQNFWHGRQIRQVAKAVSDDMEHLYLTYYKTTSGISHGSAYPILSRNEKPEWVIGFKKGFWVRCEKESWIFAYLMLGQLFVEVFQLFQIPEAAHLDATAGVCMKLTK